jgi:hypothetical protein
LHYQEFSIFFSAGKKKKRNPQTCGAKTYAGISETVVSCLREKLSFILLNMM